MAHLGLRLLQFFWTLLIMALTGNMIAEAIAGNHSAINFTMFVAVFAMLSLLYLILASIVTKFAVPLVMLVLDIINTLLFLIAGIVMAARLGVHSCDNEGYLVSNSITNGGLNMEKRCREGQAVTAFLWFGFATFLASTVFSFILSKRRGAGSGSARGPQMSRV